MPADTLCDKLQASLGATYIIERELGGGGMSRVFLSEETRFRRRVVIKVLSPDLAAGLSVERFEREIGLAAALQQANIVPVITAGDIDGLPWYSMPYVEGETLRARLERGSVPPADATKILSDVARALAPRARRRHLPARPSWRPRRPGAGRAGRAGVPACARRSPLWVGDPR